MVEIENNGVALTAIDTGVVDEMGQDDKASHLASSLHLTPDFVDVVKPIALVVIATRGLVAASAGWLKTVLGPLFPVEAG